MKMGQGRHRKSDCSRHGLMVAVLAIVFAASGASCPRRVPSYATPLPRALPPGPTLEQVLQTVNQNTQQIQSFSASKATLTGEGFPSLRAVVVFQRPLRFRLRAQMALSTGPEVDLGSNDELFWFWVKRNQPPALYFCRHEQFATSPVRQTFPFEPQWLIEALGLPWFDPALPHQGPFPLGNDQVEIRTIRETPQGPQTKVTVVDAVRGCVLQQRVYDYQGRLIAQADSTQHRRDPLTGLILPTVVDVRSIPAGVSMRIDMGLIEVNRLNDPAGELWMVPNYPNTPAVDLCDPRRLMPVAQ